MQALINRLCPAPPSPSFFGNPSYSVYTASLLRQGQWGWRAIELWNWATTSPWWLPDPGSAFLELYRVWAGPKGINGFWPLLGLKLGKDFHDLGQREKNWSRIRFCSPWCEVCFHFILFYYSFIYLLIFFIRHLRTAAGLKKGKGNYVDTFHPYQRPNFPGGRYPSGAAERMQW